MIELFFVTCLVATPQQCEERSLTFIPETGAVAGIMGCMMTAQAQLAQWSETYPGHRIERWSCRPVARGEAKI